MTSLSGCGSPSQLSLSSSENSTPAFLSRKRTPSETSRLITETRETSDEEHNSSQDYADAPLTTTLLITVFVVTLGSSLQFGYATGEL
jgi:hypothetical protein